MVKEFSHERELADDNAAHLYKGCKSLLCKQCTHYKKFLTVSTMQMICWNTGDTYEEG